MLEGPIILTAQQAQAIFYALVLAIIMCVIFLAWPSTDDPDRNDKDYY